MGARLDELVRAHGRLLEGRGGAELDGRGGAVLGGCKGQPVTLSHGRATCLNSLSRGQSLSRSQTMVSEDGTFELGFFTAGTSHNMYLGIWYVNDDKQEIVWIANRDKPLVNSSLSRLEFSEDGNLVLQNESQTIWSTNSIANAFASVEAVLLDSGNFVLRDGSRSPTMYWQSFDHPTDTWLPGAKLGIDKRTGKNQLLTSWKSPDDPSPGLFSVGIDPGGSNEYVMKWNMSKKYWSTGVWQNQVFSSVPELNYIYRFNFSSDENETYFTYSIVNPATVSRLVMTMSGQLNQQVSHRDYWNWTSIFGLPKEQTEVYAFCGPFGIFSKNLSNSCECLQGFEPYSTENTRLNHWSDGCVRRTPLQCEYGPSSKGKKDGFQKVSDVKLPADPTPHPAQSLKTCKSACMQNCSCKACAYSSTGCSMWFGALLNMQELRINDNNTQDIYLKLAAPDLRGTGGNRTLLAWGMWNADRALELIDSVLVYPSSASTLLRYINIGLLCVQENPSDRPTMSDIVSMLSNDLAALPTPNQPAFCTSRRVMKANSSTNNTGNCSVNGLTISRIEPR
ncbi:hypothetical protein RJ639_030408 [Escallonia herrerae]|uniref:Uncharacterized protein n=1 Tax=Escallonia herrerae TaxID=1293975 RepID=A0AA88X0X7_9ASTE|nr:hypothetical protein RJ639_030408 [Escallonia herrerae]